MIPCEYCGKIFARYKHMEQHRDTVHNYPCEHCTLFFNTEEELYEHKIEDHFIVECDEETCDLLFLSDELMKEHWYENHYFLCRYCNYFYPTQKEHDDHVHDEHYTVSCQYCDKYFREVEHMEQHKKAVHEDVEYMEQHKGDVHYFPCRYCNYFYPTQKEHDDHVHDEHYTVSCQYCDKYFREVEHMEQHKKAVHEDVEYMEQHKGDVHYFPCRYCNYFYPTQKEHDDHVHDEHYTVSCQYCDKYFREVEHMEQHKKAVHEDVEYMEQHKGDVHYFPCRYCNYSFSTQKEHDDHVNDEHNTVSCQYCDKYFREVEHMEQHKKAVHEDVDYFPCSYCYEYTLDYENQRINHYRNYHRIEC